MEKSRVIVGPNGKGGWTATCLDRPECKGHGSTQEEALEALKTLLEGPEEDAGLHQTVKEWQKQDEVIIAPKWFPHG